MCTVSYIPTSKGYYLTSNRDEKNTRSISLEPKEYNHNDYKIIFPKDTDANGTWIVLKENGDALCLLNGAFVNFTAKEKYRKSRGIIVLELAATENSIETFRLIDLENIAPFTIIIVQNKILYECRWDGASKYLVQLDNAQSYIWSSVTLYNESQRAIRQNWFANFINKNNTVQQSDIFNFHKNAGDGCIENNLVMNREGEYFTVSITSIVVEDEIVEVQYQNIISNNTSVAKFTKEFA